MSTKRFSSPNIICNISISNYVQWGISHHIQMQRLQSEVTAILGRYGMMGYITEIKN